MKSELDIYRHHYKFLELAFKRDNHKTLSRIVTEYSADTGLPLINRYKYAGEITGEIEFCDSQIKRLEIF